MKTQQKKMILIMLIFFISLLFLNPLSYANSNDNLVLQPLEYSDDFKEWLQLSDEEKSKVIMPNLYDIEYTRSKSKNPLNIVRSIRASINSRFSLKDIIPENLVIKNQQQTGECWAFSALSSLETNLALTDYKNGVSQPKVYDYSERHMDYSTSKVFANGMINEKGYNRKVGSGGAYQFAQTYLTNGMGAIPESEMPFENNEDLIDISEIQNKTVSSQVYDTILFPDYSLLADDERTDVMNQIKEHIQNYGSVFAHIHGNSSSSFGFSCYNNETAAKYCNSSTLHPIDHGISLIGWDDNYSVDNFSEDARPSSNGAWIARNSWGEKVEYSIDELKELASSTYPETWPTPDDVTDMDIEAMGYTIEGDIAYIEYGDEGLIYISYEDYNVSKQLFGIVKAADKTDYDYIYQYDELFPPIEMSTNYSDILLGTIFNKQSTNTEYLTQVSIYSPREYTYKVYVNPNGTGMTKNDLQAVELKAGEFETLKTGYHTLEFANPIKLTSDSFAVVVEVINENHGIVVIPLECQVEELAGYWNEAKTEEGKCFISIGNDFNNINWQDLGTGSNPGDSTIKAFTTTDLNDGSIKNIEITTPPTKTTYFEGENFDKTGMVVTANYNSEETPSVVLDDSSYSIINGSNLQVGQTSVTISYEGKTVEQPITVEENSIVNLEITTPPTKTTYFEGEAFDKTGMVVEATYKDGSTKAITNYTIDDGNNLNIDQTYITISYNGQTIQQAITVVSNPLIEISITYPPSKTEYIVGQNFDKTGMIVAGIYENGATKQILDYTIENGTNLYKGQTSVTITYNGLSTTQNITVVEKSVVGISITKLPSKTQYIQNEEDLDLTGGLLKVTYNDNSTEELNLNSELITVEGFDNTNIGTNTIEITYMEFTITLDVVIIENPNISNPDDEEPDDQNPDDQNPDDQNPDDQDPDDEEPDDQNPDDQNPDDQNPDDQNPDDQNPDDQDPDDQNPDDQDPDDEDDQKGNAESSNFDNADYVINKVQLHTFIDKNTQEYLLVDLTINGISRNTENDSYKYYYYLSPNQDENSIQDWIEINEEQTSNDSISFEVNSKDIKNYLELLSSDTLYLYIREVTTKGGSQAVTVSKPMKVELNTDIDIEIYRDNAKIENMNSNNNSNNNNNNNNNQSGNDSTIAQENFPKTGLRNILIIGVAIILLGTLVFFIRYKILNSYVK